MYTRFGQQKISLFFFGFHRKLARTKTKKIAEKSSKHNGCTLLLWALVLLTHASPVVASTSSFILNDLCTKLPHNFCQLPFSPSPPQPTECSTTDRVRRPLGLGGHVKSYDPVAPQSLNDDNTMATTYLTAANLYVNHRTCRESSVIAIRQLQQNSEIIFQESTVSGINNVFSSILLLFYFLFPCPCHKLK